MALQLPKSIFFHTPKTGGCWVRQAILNSGIPTNEVIPESLINKDLSGAACLHTGRRIIKAHGRFTFSFVRMPDTWLQSYWGYRMTTGWDDRHIMDREIKSDIFSEYAQAYIEKFPEQFSTMVANFTDGVDFVGRQENLVEDLIKALTLAGEEFDPAVISRTKLKNESRKDLNKEYAPGQREKILEINKDFIQEFYPS